ncbi:MAG TPA: substrate-binding domain-containing protein, partial [Candidatus Obscuribacterales bacterium]
LQKARRILSRAEALETLFLPPEDKGNARSLRLGTAPLLESRLLPFLRQLLNERTISLQPIQLQSLPETEIENRLQRGELDFGFISTVPKTRGLQHQLFNQSPYVIVIATGRKSRDWQELSFIRLLQGEIASDPWPEHLWPRQVIAEADIKMALALCSRGQGALLLPQVLAESWLRPGRLQLGPPPPFELHFRSYLTWSEHTRQAPERLEWLQRLKQIGE